MRYFLVTYIQRPNGQIDEQVEVVNRLRRRDYQMVNVIMDFRDMRILACNMQGIVATRDWEVIHNYFLQHYQNIFERLHRENMRIIKVENLSQSNTDTAEESVEQDNHKTLHVESEASA